MSNTDSIERWEPPNFSSPSAQEVADIAAMADAARQKGYADGYQEGLAAAEREVEQLATIVAQLHAPYQTLEQIVARELTTLTTSLARHVIGRELTTDSTIIESSLKQALAALSQLEGAVTIHLHPVDKLLVENLAPQLLDEQSWRLLEDSALMPGGCILETPHSYVDASIEQRMETLFSQAINDANDGSDNHVIEPAADKPT